MAINFKENPGQATVINLSWGISKLDIAMFIRKVANDVVSLDGEFNEKYPGAASRLGDLFYDLGHQGRDFEEFPKSLEISGPAEEIAIKKFLSFERSSLEVSTTVSEFLCQIVPTVAGFLREHPSYQTTGKKDYEKDISALEDIVAKTRSWQAKIRVDPDYGKYYLLDKISYSLPS